MYDAARISARHEGQDRRGHRPRREQPSARGAAGAERCEGHRLRQEGARGARRRGGALRGARRGAAPRRGLSARSGRGRRLPHARDAARRTGAAGGEDARRGHHERDGGVLRRLSVSHSRRDRQRRQDHHRERHCRASQGRGTARVARRQHRPSAARGRGADDAGRSCGAGAFLVPADGYAVLAAGRGADEPRPEPSGRAPRHGGVHRVQGKYLPAPERAGHRHLQRRQRHHARSERQGGRTCASVLAAGGGRRRRVRARRRDLAARCGRGARGPAAGGHPPSRLAQCGKLYGGAPCRGRTCAR